MFEIRTVSLVHINRFVFLALALGIARGLLPGPAAANTLAAWVELVGPDMEASIRAIVSTDSTCPELQLGDETVQMQVRAEPGPSVLAEKQAEFPVRVCEAKVPAAERKITLEGVALPVPAAEFIRIVIVGGYGMPHKKEKHSRLQRSEILAVSPISKSGSGCSSGPGHPCGRLSLSRKILPGAD